MGLGVQLGGAAEDDENITASLEGGREGLRDRRGGAAVGGGGEEPGAAVQREPGRGGADAAGGAAGEQRGAGEGGLLIGR